MTVKLAKPNIFTVRRIALGLATNDTRPLVEALDESVIWRSNSTPPFFRFDGEHRTRAGVMEFLAKLYADYAFTRYDIDSIAEIGNDVWAVSDVEVFHRPTQRAVAGRLAFRMTFKDGKLTAYEGFFDTANVLQQQGRLKVA